MLARRRRAARASEDCAVEEEEELEARAETELTPMAAEAGEEGDENGLTKSSDSPSDTMKEDWSVNATCIDLLFGYLYMYTSTTCRQLTSLTDRSDPRK